MVFCGGQGEEADWGGVEGLEGEGEGTGTGENGEEGVLGAEEDWREEGWGGGR